MYISFNVSWYNYSNNIAKSHQAQLLTLVLGLKVKVQIQRYAFDADMQTDV